MLLFVTLLTIGAGLAAAAPEPVSNVFEIDISPEEAQKYLNSPPFTEPQLSGRTNVLPLIKFNDPRFRSAEAGPTLGHYWKNGHEIENTDDYVEEVYDASQFHGQDGLGAYAYGYRAPESAKVENRARTGDVTGSYTYKDGNNELIKVRYWADSEGFHQEDNLPKVQLEPAQETEEVRQARLAHEKAWKEAADAALHPNAQYQPQPSSDNYQYQPQASVNYQAYQPQPSGNYQGYQPQAVYQDYQAQGSEVQSAVAAAPAREGKAYQAGPQYQQQYSTTEEPEPTGPPRGFFYSFDYPVSIIVRKDAQGGAGAVNPGFPVDHDTVSVNAQRG